MPTEEEIFSYPLPDGTVRWADPIAVHADLELALQGQAQAVVEATRNPDPDAFRPAVERLRAAVLAAFDLGPPFDPATGEGVRRETWMGALNAFLAFMEEHKKKAATSPTCSPPTGTAPSGGEPCPTPSGTASG